MNCDMYSDLVDCLKKMQTDKKMVVFLLPLSLHYTEDVVLALTPVSTPLL